MFAPMLQSSEVATTGRLPGGAARLFSASSMVALAAWSTPADRRPSTAPLPHLEPEGPLAQALRRDLAVALLDLDADGAPAELMCRDERAT